MTQRVVKELVCVCVCVCSVAQSCPTLCDPMDYSPPGSSVHGTSKARILAWVAISFSMRFSQPVTKPMLLASPILVARFFITSATWETQRALITDFFPMICIEISVCNKADGSSSVSSHILWHVCPRGNRRALLCVVMSRPLNYPRD